MANIRTILFLLSISGFAASGVAKHYSSKAYIKSQCQGTLYPALCIRTLSLFAPRLNFQNPQDLASIALKVSLCRAEYTKSYLLKVARRTKTLRSKEYTAVKECLIQIKDSVDQLSMSIRELHRVEREKMTGRLTWHVSNVQTWMSSAMTDASTCLDEFEGRRMSKLRATIKGKVKNVEEVTSNALVLFHRYAAVRVRAMAIKKP